MMQYIEEIIKQSHHFTLTALFLLIVVIVAARTLFVRKPKPSRLLETGNSHNTSRLSLQDNLRSLFTYPTFIQYSASIVCLKILVVFGILFTKRFTRLRYVADRPRDFKRLIEGGWSFVDKTLLIDEFCRFNGRLTVVCAYVFSRLLMLLSNCFTLQYISFRLSVLTDLGR